jgi:hypothetical protein
MRPSRSVSAAALLFVLIAGFYWKLTLTKQYEWMRGPDLAEQVLPWFEVQAREWHAGRLPLWDPYVWSGQPLLGQAQPGAAYPLNWILFVLPLVDGHISQVALNWYYVAIHLMAAAFCFLFCRELGRSRGASLAGGLIFSLSGFLGSTPWPQMMNGAVWAPLVFLFQLRACRTRRARDAALSGFFLGVSWLSGHHQIPMFVTLAWIGVWIWFAVRDRAAIHLAILAIAICALTSGLQTVPAYEYGRLARRWAGAPQPLEWNQAVPYSVHEHYDLKAYSFFGVVYPGVEMHFDPFIGIAALALALLGIAAAWNDSRVRVLSAIGLGGILLALGHNSVFHGILYAIVPEFDKARAPSSAVLLFQFAAAALAASGADHLDSLWTRRVQWGLTIFGALTLVGCGAILFANRLTFPTDDRVILTGFVALALAALFRARPAIAPALLILLLLFELGNYSQIQLARRDDAGQMTWQTQLKTNSDIAEYIRKQPGFPRADVANGAFAPNWGAWHNVEMFGGSGAGVTINVLDSDYFSEGGRRLWGVAYTIAAAPPRAGAQEIFAGASGIKVYPRDAMPRAWAVHATPCPSPDHVELVEHAADRLAIHADLACSGTVVLSDTFYPGWRARVDHKAATIKQINGAMRAVDVPQGTHVITMRYRPWSVILGAAATLLGAILTFVFAALGRNEPRP